MESARSPATPQEYLDELPVTKSLVALGVTPSQLGAISFRGRSEGLPFSQWSMRLPTDMPAIPNESTPLLRQYCTWKWLVLDNPPGSRDKDDAWLELELARIGPLVASATKGRDRLRKNSALGAEASTKYRPNDYERWRAMALEPEIARLKFKTDKARAIARREGRPDAAVDTIRRNI
jgi:hypothetical protein